MSVPEAGSPRAGPLAHTEVQAKQAQREELTAQSTSVSCLRKGIGNAMQVTGVGLIIVGFTVAALCTPLLILTRPSEEDIRNPERYFNSPAAKAFDAVAKIAMMGIGAGSAGAVLSLTAGRVREGKPLFS